MELDLYKLPVLVAGVATLTIGIFIARYQFPGRGSRALALICLLKGAALVCAGLLASVSVNWVGVLLHVQHYILLPMVILALYTLALHTSWGHEHQRFLVFGAILLVLLAEGAYALNNALVHTLQRSETGQGLASAGPGWVYADYGPLVVLLALGSAALALLAVLFARQATRGEPKQRIVAYWFAVGFIVNGVFDGGMAIAYLIHDPAIGGVSGLGWILGISRSLALLPAGIALGILVGSELSKPVAQGWRWGMPAVLALAAWFSGPMPVIFGAADYGQTWPTAVATGLWRAALPALMGVGLWQLRLASLAPATAPVGVATPKET